MTERHRGRGPDPNRLDTYRARVQDLAERVMDGVAGWSATDALGADIRALAGAAVTFVDATDHEQLPELDATLRSASSGALDVVRAVDAAAAGLQGLSTAVAGVDPTGPTADRTVRLRRALVGAAHELRGLGVATRALADARSHREEWTEATAQVADDLTDALAEVIERVGQAGATDADAAPENPADSTKDLGADLGRLATRESHQALGFRTAAIVLLLAIAGLAWSVLWRSPLDSTAVVRDLAKLAAAIPLALLVAYLQKQAAQHRAYAGRLEELEIQLRHVDRYFAGRERHERRAELWQRWTSGLPNGEATSPTVTDDLAAILERIAELMKSIGSLGRN